MSDGLPRAIGGTSGNLIWGAGRDTDRDGAWFIASDPIEESVSAFAVICSFMCSFGLVFDSVVSLADVGSYC